jgi:SAM-dependent methyltransferase
MDSGKDRDANGGSQLLRNWTKWRAYWARAAYWHRDWLSAWNAKRMDENTTRSVRESYDRLAEEYAIRLFDELQQKPLDRNLLVRFATEVGDGQVCDMGCGPGHVGRYLSDLGVRVFGLDLSPQMVQQARKLNPDLSFREGNMLALDLPDESLAGIAAFYAIVNIPKESLLVVFREMSRVLRPGGLLLLAFHVGDDVYSENQLWGIRISMDFFFFQPSVIRRFLERAGFVIEDVTERPPYAPDVEYQSKRAYIFARKRAQRKNNRGDRNDPATVGHTCR